MKKKLIENYRVEVVPLTYYRPADKADCEGIIQQIGRHVDDVGSATVVWDEREVCSFCGYEWEVLTAAYCTEPGDEPGMPVCCQAAIDEWREARHAE